MGETLFTDWVFIVEGEFKSVGVAFIQMVVIENFDIHLPFL